MSQKRRKAVRALFLLLSLLLIFFFVYRFIGYQSLELPEKHTHSDVWIPEAGEYQRFSSGGWIIGPDRIVSSREEIEEIMPGDTLVVKVSQSLENGDLSLGYWLWKNGVCHRYTETISDDQAVKHIKYKQQISFGKREIYCFPIGKSGGMLALPVVGLIFGTIIMFFVILPR